MSVGFRWLSLVVCGVALLGCADATTLGPSVGPAPSRAMSSTWSDSYGSVPYFESEDEVPPEWWHPKVHSVDPWVDWEGNTATAASRMGYYGNRAEETFTLKISGPSPDSRPAEGRSIGGFLPDDYEHETDPFTLTVNGTCGHLANLISQHTAKIVFVIDVKGLQVPDVTRTGDAKAKSQPDCPKEVEPDDPPPGEGGSGGGSGGGGGGDTMTCKTTTYAVETWNGSYWEHNHYEYETVCWYN